jgi:HlyD family secretion protein
MAKSHKRRKILILGVIVLGLAGLTTAAFLKKHEPVIIIQTDKVVRRNLTEIVIANGKIQPVTQVKISPEVSGEIISLPVKEGMSVRKGDLLLKIKPDFYMANRNQAEASYKSSVAGQTTAAANLQKAEAELKRNQELYDRKLISDSLYIEYKTACEVARAQATSAAHQVEMSKAFLARAEEELAKTTIVSPLTGTVSKLNSQVGERVVGTATMAGTDVMILADLNEMEARVDIGEIDVVLIKPGQNVRLEVDAFKDRKFTGTVTEIANSSKGSGYSMGGSQQEATKFEVKIRIKEKEAFRPGMSVTAEIETRSRTNVLTVPFASVTTRLPKEEKNKAGDSAKGGSTTNRPANPGKTNSPTTNSGPAAAATNAAKAPGTNDAAGDRKAKESKPIEVVFLVETNRARMAPVKIGICDDSYWEITDGLKEGQEVVSGGFRAISRDLEDGKKVQKGPAISERDKDTGKKGRDKEKD